MKLSQTYNGFSWFFTTVKDAVVGIIDLAHMAATIEGYLGSGLPPAYWAGWGGDLATGMADTMERFTYRNSAGYEIYADKDLQTIANMTIGNVNSRCNYSDFCCDFDAYAIKKKIEIGELDGTHMLSDAMQWYYTSEYVNRFLQIYDELDRSKTLGSLRDAVYNKMNGTLEKAGLLNFLAGDATDEVNEACCKAFANYIYSMI